MTCPCGSSKDFDACCGPYLAGREYPPTAEALMRSRYSAYTQQQVDYIVATHDPGTREEVDRDDTAKWAREAGWQGLEVVSTERGREGDDDGVVEFKARFTQN